MNKQRTRLTSAARAEPGRSTGSLTSVVLAGRLGLASSPACSFVVATSRSGDELDPDSDVAAGGSSGSCGEVLTLIGLGADARAPVPEEAWSTSALRSDLRGTSGLGRLSAALKRYTREALVRIGGEERHRAA